LDARPTALTGGHHDHELPADVLVRVDLLALLEGAADQPGQHLAAAVLGAGGGAGDPAGSLARLGAGSDGKLPAQPRGVALLLVLGLRLDALKRRGVVANGHATAADREYRHIKYLNTKGTNRWPGPVPAPRGSQSSPRCRFGPGRARPVHSPAVVAPATAGSGPPPRRRSAALAAPRSAGGPPGSSPSGRRGGPLPAGRARPTGRWRR